MADNRILALALDVQDREPEAGADVFVTKDINLRIRADALGLMTEDYEADKSSISELYTGMRELEVARRDIDAFYQHGELAAPRQDRIYAQRVRAAARTRRTRPTPRSPSTTPDKQRIVPLLKRCKDGVWGIRPRNKEQASRSTCCSTTTIKLVTLVGKAGTGKTLLAIAAGLQKTMEEQVYQKLLVSRPDLPARPRHRLPARRHRGEAQPVDAAHLRQRRVPHGPLAEADKKAGRSYHELLDLGRHRRSSRSPTSAGAASRTSTSSSTRRRTSRRTR